MAINADFLKAPADQKTVVEEKYYYTDILLDLKLGYTKNYEALADNEKKDLTLLYDMNVIVTSIRNFLVTSPGQKILNPFFGLDLRRYIFEPVTNINAFLIKNEIIGQLTNYEPRVKINDLIVTPYPEDQLYVVQIIISPTVNYLNTITEPVTLAGILNSDGYFVVDGGIIYNRQNLFYK